MATSDMREPSVYVNIEDRSYVGPPAESGRVVYGVILCDRGPDNRVVTVTSQKEYQKLFGAPNIQRCSQTHYMLNKALQYTGKVLVCRVSPINANLANTLISTSSTTIALSGTSFTFSNEAYNSYGEIYEKTESSTRLTIEIGTKTIVIDTGLDWVSERVLIKYNESTFMSADVTSYDEVTGELVVDVTSVIGTGTYTSWEISTNDDQYIGDFVYGLMECSLDDMEELVVGQWIYSDVDTSALARQIVSLTEDASGCTALLDQPYTGTETEGGVNILVPYTVSNVENIISPDNITDGDNFVYHFYANGAGEYYNDLTLKCARNYEIERVYTDDNGVPYYPYTFMDVYLYHTDSNGVQTLLEGPWTVSLIRKTANNELFRYFAGGQPTYIEDVINTNSNFIRVKSGSQVENMTPSTDAAKKLRLQLMLELARTSVIGMTNVGNDGFNFAEGSDGSGLYDASGNISPSTSVYGRVSNAYIGSLTSIDGTIENLPEFIYPFFNLDYIVSGGYPINVQYSAAQLAALREDCHHLADTGVYYNNYIYDIQARQQTAAWNFWTSSLYVQYRKMVDDYTGTSIWMSPVYHAIQTHLNTDNNYFLAEPPCNMEKGAIGDAIQLAYQTNHTSRGDLFDKELNYTIAEANGVYFATQFTTWKRYSALKRQHIAKFVSYLKKKIPDILKDVVQRKATQNWLSQTQFRVNNFFLKYLDGQATDRYACINSFTATIEFDRTRSEMNIYVTFQPILAIERINVFLTIPTQL